MAAPGEIRTAGSFAAGARNRQLILAMCEKYTLQGLEARYGLSVVQSFSQNGRRVDVRQINDGTTSMQAMIHRNGTQSQSIGGDRCSGRWLVSVRKAHTLLESLANVFLLSLFFVCTDLDAASSDL